MLTKNLISLQKSKHLVAKKYNDYVVAVALPFY